MKSSLEQANEDIETIIRQTEAIKKGKYFGVIDLGHNLYGPYHGNYQKYQGHTDKFKTHKKQTKT